MLDKQKKFFPITTTPACRVKWAWSTIFLNSGITSSCHRASNSMVDTENFFNFHNTERKVADRQMMLEGQWPGHGCEYCKDVETVGGHSDRMFQATVPDMHPTELDIDKTLTIVDPVVLEVFIKNTCNLACIYCNASFSSRIEGEDARVGTPLSIYAEKDQLPKKQSEKFIPLFWQWLDKGYSKLKRIHVLGGEPFLIDEFHKLIDYIDAHPNPNLELNIVSNLMINQDILIKFSFKIKELIRTRKLKRVEILASVECWGKEQEYIRYGFNCDKFEQNFQYLVDQKYIVLGILSTINSLSIRSMPELAIKFINWNTQRKIFWYTHLVGPINEHVLSPNYFDFNIYKESLEKVKESTKDLSIGHDQNIKVLNGIIKKLETINKTNTDKQNKLLEYLNEIDKRRNLNWKIVFPWLEEEFKKCGIQE